MTGPFEDDETETSAEWRNDGRPPLNTKHEVEMLRAAATACENASSAEWFQWVPAHLRHLAVLLAERR